jgi:hypothetical protein
MRLPPINALSRLLRRTPLSPEERALYQRRRLVKLTGLAVLALGSLFFLAFLFFAMPGRLSNGELGVLAMVGIFLFGSRLLSLARRINVFRRRR